MKNFMIFAIILTVMLVIVSLLLDRLAGLFIVGLIACLWLKLLERDELK